MALSIIEKSKFYFYKFPVVDYNWYGIDRPTLDFIHRWAFRKNIKNNVAAYSKWIVRDEDTIFSIADRIYNSQHYYWIIMMMNDMIDPIFDWPLEEKDLLPYVKSIYGGGDAFNDPHHIEADASDDINALPEGTIVSESYPLPKKIISNFEYEAKINEEKRAIKLLLPEYLETVLREKDEILATNFNRI